jgi:signal transduction histidine kinase/integral membrane sensor domain MASE1
MYDFQLLVGRVRSIVVVELRRAHAAVLGKLSTWPEQLVSLRSLEGRQALWRSASPCLGFAAAYLAAYIYGNGLPSPAPLWPPDAILLSALLLTTPRRWWIYLLITVPIRMLPALAPGVPGWLLIVNLLNDTLQAVLAAVLVRHFAPRPLGFMTLRAMGIYMASAVLLAPLLSSFIGAAGLVALGNPYWQTWKTWFLGDALTSLVLTPTIVMWVTASKRGLRAVPRERRTEALLLGAALLVVGGLLVFNGITQVMDDAIYYLPIPLLIWAAVRLGPRGTAGALTVVTCFAIASGIGYWGLQAARSTPREVLSLQLFLIATAVPLLLLAAQIEERKQTVKKVERQAEELDRVFEAVSDGIVVYDREGHALRINSALQRLLRLDVAPSEYEQMPFYDRVALFEVRDEQGQPLPPGVGPLGRALADEVTSGEQAADIRARSLDGHELELNLSAAPLRDDTGELVGVVCVFRNQTERKQLEREMAEQAEQLDRIVEGMGDGLFVYDTEGRVVRTNAAARRLLSLGAVPVDFPRLSAENQIALYASSEHQGDHMLTPKEWLASRAVTGTGDVLSRAEAQDVRLYTLDGRELEVSANAAPLHSPAGEVVGAVLLLSDRTERNQLVREREEARANELALREVNQQLDTFVGMAAHDLRQPVAAAKLVIDRVERQVRKAAGKAQAARKPMVPVAQVETALDEVQGNLDRLWRLVEQLLDVTQARQGILTLHREPCHVEDIVRAGVEEQRLLTPNRSLSLDLPHSGELPIMVDADAQRLGQVLTNYLANAVRYSPADQPIEVALQVIEPPPEDGAFVRVAVRDYGPGIAPEERMTIWDRFQRARSPNEGGSGLGLGLYIARTIIERHGGHVGVESTVGAGSTFWFTLPLAPARAADAELSGELSEDPPRRDDMAS